MCAWTATLHEPHRVQNTAPNTHTIVYIRDVHITSDTRRGVRALRSVTFGIIRAWHRAVLSGATSLGRHIDVAGRYPLQGEYRGSSPAEIRFLVDGEEQAYKIEDVQSGHTSSRTVAEARLTDGYCDPGPARNSNLIAPKPQW